ncbi:DUF1127 domain-containing protein [Roseobacteraceae bacterium S113]
MAHFVDELTYHPTLMERLGTLIETVSIGTSRAREMDRLSAMSDQQLAARGLRREDIARHVFRDIIHV